MVFAVLRHLLWGWSEACSVIFSALYADLCNVKEKVIAWVFFWMSILLNPIKIEWTVESITDSMRQRRRMADFCTVPNGSVSKPFP